MSAYAREFGGDLTLKSQKPNALTQNLALKFGEDHRLTKGARFLDYLFKINDQSQAQKHFLSAIRADESGDLIGFVTQIAKESPKIQNNLRHILTTTTNNLTKRLESFGLDSLSVKDIFSNFEKGTKDDYREAMEGILAKVYDDNYKVVLSKEGVNPKEARGIHNVTHNGKNATIIHKDLENIDEAILYASGNRYKGAKHIRIKHSKETNKQGYVTDSELANLGRDIREFLKHNEPFIDSNGARLYEWERDGVRFRAVVNDIADMDSNPTTAMEEIITFYSDRNLKEPMRFKNPSLTHQKESYAEFRKKLDESGVLAEDSMRFLNFVEKNIYNEKGVTFEQLNNALKNINSYYKQTLDPNFKSFLKQSVEGFLREDIKSGIEQIFAQNKELYKDASALFSTALSDYATMKKALKTIDRLKVRDEAKSKAQALNNIYKYLQGQGGEVSNIQNLIKGLSPEQKANFEVALLYGMFQKTLLDLGKDKVFNSRAFFENLGNLAIEFQSKEAKDFIDIAKGFDTLFKNDALIAQSLGAALPKEVGSSIATSIEGAAKFQMVKMMFEALMRLMPHIPFAKGFNEKIQGMALRYHLRKALNQSSDISEFKFNLKKAGENPSINSPTRELINKITSEVNEAQDEILEKIAREEANAINLKPEHIGDDPLSPQGKGDITTPPTPSSKGYDLDRTLSGSYDRENSTTQSLKTTTKDTQNGNINHHHTIDTTIPNDNLKREEHIQDAPRANGYDNDASTPSPSNPTVQNHSMPTQEGGRDLPIQGAKQGGEGLESNEPKELGNPLPEFGKNHSEYYHDGAGAIAKLLETKEGQVAGAFHREDVGDITLAWGEAGTGKSDGWGLAKIEKFHPEVLDRLDELVQGMPITKETPNRYQLENEDYKIAIRKDYDGESGNWLLTAFEKKESIARRRTDLPSTETATKKTALVNADADSTTNLSKEQITQELQEKWVKEFGLKSVDEEFVPSFKPEVQEALSQILGDEQIKLGKGSLVKLIREHREKYLDRIKPTLQEPDRVILQNDGAIIFARDFNEKKFFTSVARNDKGEWVITSNAPKSENGLNNKIAQGGREIYNKQAGSQINAPAPHDDVANSNTKLDGADSTTTLEKVQDSTPSQAASKKQEVLNRVLAKKQEQLTKLQKQYDEAVFKEHSRAIPPPNQSNNSRRAADRALSTKIRKLLDKIEEKKKEITLLDPKASKKEKIIAQRGEIFYNAYKKAYEAYVKDGAKVFLDKDIHKVKFEGFSASPYTLGIFREIIEAEFNINPLKEFGTNYAEGYHDGKFSIQKLLNEAKDYEARKETGDLTQEEIAQEAYKGQVAGAFHRDDLGDIDLVWGNENLGLKKIVDKHLSKGDFEAWGEGEQALIKGLSDIIENGKLLTENNVNTIILHKDGNTYRLGISKGWFDKGENNWIITAYKVEKKSPDSDSLPSNQVAKSDGTNLHSNDLPANSTTKAPTTQTLTKQQAYHKIVGEYGKIFKKLPKVLADKDIDSILRDTKTLADIRKRSFDERGFNPSLAELAAQDYFKKEKAITAFIYKAREYGLDLGFSSFTQFFKKRYGTQIKNDEQVKDMLASLDFFKSIKIDENPQRFTDVKMSEDKSGFNSYVESKINKYLGIDEMAKKLTHNPKFDELQAMLDLYQARRITKNPKDIQKVEQYANTLRPFFPSLVNKNTSDFLYEIDNLAYYAHNLLQSKVYIDLDSNFLYPAREAIEYFLDIKPIKEFGKNYAEYFRDGQRGIAKLLAEAKDYEARKEAGKLTEAEIEQGAYKGQVAGAFYKEGLGDIDLVWGNENLGLQKIINKHLDDFKVWGEGEDGVIKGLDDIVSNGKVISENGLDTIWLKKNDEYYLVGLSKGYNGVGDNKWVITSYKKDDITNVQKEKVDKLFDDSNTKVFSAVSEFNELRSPNPTTKDDSTTNSHNVSKAQAKKQEVLERIKNKNKNQLSKLNNKLEKILQENNYSQKAIQKLNQMLKKDLQKTIDYIDNQIQQNIQNGGREFPKDSLFNLLQSHKTWLRLIQAYGKDFDLIPDRKITKDFINDFIEKIRFNNGSIHDLDNYISRVLIDLNNNHINSGKYFFKNISLDKDLKHLEFYDPEISIKEFYEQLLKTEEYPDFLIKVLALSDKNVNWIPFVIDMKKISQEVGEPLIDYALPFIYTPFIKAKEITQKIREEAIKKGYSVSHIAEQSFYSNADVKTIRKTIERFYEIKPLAEFGTNYAEGYHDGAFSIQKLLNEAKDYEARKAIGELTEEELAQGAYKGQVAGAFYKEELGDIDLVWGDSTFGLAHILERRGAEIGEQKAIELIRQIPQILQDSTIYKQTDNKIELITDKYTLVLGVRGDKKFVVSTLRDRRNPKKLETIQTRVADDFTSETLANKPLSQNQQADSSTSLNKKQYDFSTKGIQKQWKF